MRQILHVHRDGKYAAIDNPDAVVVDYGAQMLRVGLDRWIVTRPTVWRFIAFMMRSADVTQHYAAVIAAVSEGGCSRGHISKIAADAESLLVAMGMTLETIDNVGYRLHSDPRESLACSISLAPGQPLPSRLRNTRSAPARRRTTCAKSPAR